MANEVKGNAEKEKADQRLNVDIHLLGTILTNKSPTNDKAAEGDQKKEVTNVSRSRRVGRWVWARLASSEFWTAAATVIIAAFTIELYCVSTQQGKTMRQQLEFSERPWIAEQITLISPPLIFEKDGGSSIVKMVMENNGNSVAINVHPLCELGAPVNDWKRERSHV